jgi:hypothetical protein
MTRGGWWSTLGVTPMRPSARFDIFCELGGWGGGRRGVYGCVFGGKDWGAKREEQITVLRHTLGAAFGFAFLEFRPLTVP